MQIEKLYVYPIKSFRGVSLDKATVTKYGFTYDRSFMLLQIVDDNGTKVFKNMSVANYNEMVRFFPDIDAEKGIMTITFKPIDNSEPRSIDIPLEPDTSSLELIDIEMHKAPTQAYKMDAKYNDWLSSCFEYETVLAYIGENTRKVRCSALSYKTPIASQTNGDNAASGWLSSVSSIASKATGMIMGTESKPTEIRFSDVAPFLFVSSRSMDDVHNRLPEGQNMDITKFRPNVIVSGAKEPWDEDYWGELTIGGATKVICEHNCGRCKSINIDYNTGAQGKGEEGKMLKYLMSNRRVDKGAKWTPVFGRYSWLEPASEGNEIHVGDEVDVSKTNTERTAFGKWLMVLYSLIERANAIARLDGSIYITRWRERLIHACADIFGSLINNLLNSMRLRLTVGRSSRIMRLRRTVRLSSRVTVVGTIPHNINLDQNVHRVFQSIGKRSHPQAVPSHRFPHLVNLLERDLQLLHDRLDISRA
jgi:uncharacterized protein YcbX